MKLGIMGYGVVGKAIDYTLSKKFNIKKYDKYSKLDKFEDLLDTEFIFISVPTPFDCRTNKVDDSAVIECLEMLNSKRYEGVVILKSTIPPGSCLSYEKKFNLEIVFNPEFLRESTTPNEDFENQDTVVIGTNIDSIFKKVKDMFCEVLIEGAVYFQTSSLEAEMIKCAQNTMLASRVAIANMIFDICSKNEVDYDIVRKIAFDRFEIIGPSMVLVPGPDGNRGFGGKCLPKDIRALSTVSESLLLKEIINYNDTLRSDLSLFLKNYNLKNK